MNKPLSETHPILWKALSIEYYDGTPYESDLDIAQWIKSCTVDVVEHERVKQWATVLEEEIKVREAEFERLKKEISDYKENKAFQYRGEKAEAIEYAHKTGLVEGERRAMERVKEAYLIHCNKWNVYPIHFLSELGLGEEEKQ